MIGVVQALGCARPKKIFKKIFKKKCCCICNIRFTSGYAWHKRNVSLLNLDVIAMGFGLSLSRLFSKL